MTQQLVKNLRRGGQSQPQGRMIMVAADEIERLRSGLAEIDMRGKQYAAEELADMARAVLDGKDPEAVFNTPLAEPKL